MYLHTLLPGAHASLLCHCFWFGLCCVVRIPVPIDVFFFYVVRLTVIRSAGTHKMPRNSVSYNLVWRK